MVAINDSDDLASQVSKDDVLFIIKYFTNTWNILGDRVPETEKIHAMVEQSFDMWDKAQVVWSTGIDEAEIEAIKDLINRLDINGNSFVEKNIILKAIDIKLGLIEDDGVEDEEQGEGGGEIKVGEKSMQENGGNDNDAKAIRIAIIIT